MQHTPSSVDVVGVLGAGVIGASWSALFLAAGKEVDVFDPTPDAEAQTREYIERAWPALEALDMVRPNASADRLHFVADAPTAVSRAQFVQESVPERLPPLFRRNHCHRRKIMSDPLLVSRQQRNDPQLPHGRQ